MAVLTRNNIVTNGLILYLDAANRQSYVSGSTIWRDISGNNNSGSLVNGPTFSTLNGGSINLDGTNDQININTIPTSSFSLISSSFTVNMWVNIQSNNAGFISSNQSPSNGGQYSFVRRYGALGISFYGTPTSTDIVGNISLPTGSWINITHVHDFSNQSSSIYQQTALVGARSMAPSPLITSSSLILGYYGFGGAYLSGSIAITQIYNRALSQAEITQNYNATKTRFGLT
jgi:hypothetical protein